MDGSCDDSYFFASPDVCQAFRYAWKAVHGPEVTLRDLANRDPRTFDYLVEFAMNDDFKVDWFSLLYPSETYVDDRTGLLYTYSIGATEHGSSTALLVSPLVVDCGARRFRFERGGGKYRVDGSAIPLAEGGVNWEEWRRPPPNTRIYAVIEGACAYGAEW